MKVHPLGRLYCPRCCARKAFIGYDDPDPSAAACIDCGYRFGYTADLRTGALVSVLTKEVVAKAKAELAEEMAREAASQGMSDALERAQELLLLPPEQRIEAIRAAGAGPKPGWTPEQWRSYAEYQRTLGTAPEKSGEAPE